MHCHLVVYKTSDSNIQKEEKMFLAELETTHGDDLTCQSAQSESDNLCHKRLGHVLFSTKQICY